MLSMHSTPTPWTLDSVNTFFMHHAHRHIVKSRHCERSPFDYCNVRRRMDKEIKQCAYTQHKTEVKGKEKERNEIA